MGSEYMLWIEYLAISFNTLPFVVASSKGLCNIPQFLLKITSCVSMDFGTFISRGILIAKQELEAQTVLTDRVCVRGDWKLFSPWIKFTAYALIWE